MENYRKAQNNLPMPGAVKPASRTLVALDLLHFFVSDVRDGIAPYLTLFLVEKIGWTSADIGWALGAGSLASLVTMAPAGLVTDASHSKRGILVGCCLLVGGSALALTLVNGFWSVIGLQVLIGIANALIAPGLVGLSLGIVGKELIAKRIGRNESFNYLGNMLASFLSVFLIRYYSLPAIFYLIAGLSCAATLSVLSIRSTQVNWMRARDLEETLNSRPLAVHELMRNKFLVQFLVVFAIYQFANASLLPIAVQMVAHRSSEDASRFLSEGVVVAQFLAVPTAFITGLYARRFSPFAPLALGLAAIITRALIFSTGSSVDLFIFAQVFDGVAAGIIAVAPILIVTSLTPHSGRFTFSAGILACAITIGASASNVISGYTTRELGPVYWFIIAGFSALTLLLFLKLTLPKFFRALLSTSTDRSCLKSNTRLVDPSAVAEINVGAPKTGLSLVGRARIFPITDDGGLELASIKINWKESHVRYKIPTFAGQPYKSEDLREDLVDIQNGVKLARSWANAPALRARFGVPGSFSITRIGGSPYGFLLLDNSSESETDYTGVPGAAGTKFVGPYLLNFPYTSAVVVKLTNPVQIIRIYSLKTPEGFNLKYINFDLQSAIFEIAYSQLRMLLEGKTGSCEIDLASISAQTIANP